MTSISDKLRNILYIEDDKGLARLLQKRLGRQGFEIDLAFERAKRARGERKINGTPASTLRRPRIRPPVVQRDGKSAPRQEERQQRACEPRADHAERLCALPAQAALSSTWVNCSVKRQTSSKQL